MSSLQSYSNIYARIVGLVDEGRDIVVVTVLKALGSTPQKVGATAVVDQGGRIYGTIGGGKVEAEAQRRAVDVCRRKKPEILEYVFDGVDARDDVPICGGAMRILLNPVDASTTHTYRLVADAVSGRDAGLILSRIRGTSAITVETCWCRDGVLPEDCPGSLRRDLASCMTENKSLLLSTDDADEPGMEEILAVPIVPRPVVLLVGGGHVGQAVAAHASLAGFDIAVIDDRAEFTDPLLFPDGTRTLCGSVAGQLERFDITKDTYAVIVTRGHQHDAEALRICINSCPGYLGMIGSRRKVALIRKDFIESGIASEAKFDEVYAPIGLDIGAVSVHEIAVSIVAQMIAVRRGAKVGRIERDKVQK